MAPAAPATRMVASLPARCLMTSPSRSGGAAHIVHPLRVGVAVLRPSAFFRPRRVPPDFGADAKTSEDRRIGLERVRVSSRSASRAERIKEMPGPVVTHRWVLEHFDGMTQFMADGAHEVPVGIPVD